MLDEDAGVRAEVRGELPADRVGANAQSNAARTPGDADPAEYPGQSAARGEFVRFGETVLDLLQFRAHAVGVDPRESGRPAGRFLRDDAQRRRRPVPQHAQRRRPADRRLVDEPRQLPRAAHALAVEFDDDVAGFDARGLGRAGGADIGHHRAFGGVVGGVFDITHRDADLAARPSELDLRPNLALDLLRLLLRRPGRRRRRRQGRENRAAPEQAFDAGRLHVDVLPETVGRDRKSRRRPRGGDTALQRGCRPRRSVLLIRTPPRRGWSGGRPRRRRGNRACACERVGPLGTTTEAQGKPHGLQHLDGARRRGGGGGPESRCRGRERAPAIRGTPTPAVDAPARHGRKADRRAGASRR